MSQPCPKATRDTGRGRGGRAWRCLLMLPAHFDFAAEVAGVAVGVLTMFAVADSAVIFRRFLYRISGV